MKTIIINAITIMAFFFSYKLYGIYAATLTLVIINALQLGCAYCKLLEYSRKQLFFSLIVLVLCGATLLLNNELFVKLKPTCIYWSCALIFLYNSLFANRLLIKKIAPAKFVLPERWWQRLNYCWILFFISIGTINLYVVYNYDTDTWVYFKVFGIVGTTVLFITLQIALYFVYQFLQRKKYSSSSES